MDELPNSANRRKTPAIPRMAMRMAVVVFCCALLLNLAQLLSNWDTARRMILREAEATARSTGERTAETIGRMLTPVERITQTVANMLELNVLDDEATHELVRQTLLHNPEIFGMAVAHAPYASPDRKFYAPYQFRTKWGIASGDGAGKAYDYFHLEWYTAASDSNRASWSEPYFDVASGDQLMITYSVPWYRTIDGQRRFAGVVTADITLLWLENLIGQIRLYNNGYASVLSSKGTYICHPLRQLVMRQTVFDLAREHGDPELAEIGQRMVAGETGFLRRPSLVGNVPSFLYYLPLPVGGWSLALLFPEQDVLANVNRLSQRMVLLGVVGLLALAVVVFWVTFRLTRPVRALSDAARIMAGGDLDLDLPALNRRDEIGVFARAFDAMRHSLREHIRSLAETTAAKERIESELRIARDIQMSILPKVFPPFPDLTELDIRASIEPAREVGGDLYDFFPIDGRRFCFLVGDVSDKGVPAALFMAVTKTLLGVVAKQGLSPGDILGRVGDDLASGNDSCMFVTLFLGIVNMDDGELSYACAGHDAPFLLRADGSVDRLPVPGEPMAGALQGLRYTTLSARLLPGDALVAYTDGVTEAMNAAGEFFGETRLREVLAATHECAAEELIGLVRRSVDTFADGAEQSDDITLLAMTYRGPGPAATQGVS